MSLFVSMVLRPWRTVSLRLVSRWLAVKRLSHGLQVDDGYLWGKWTNLKGSDETLDESQMFMEVFVCMKELVYEMEVSGGRRLHLSDFLFELLSQRCPPAGASASMSISTELGLQQTLHTWNR